MDANEAKFREVETQLDQAVSQAIPWVAEFDVRISDHLLRNYERGEYLLWRHEFEKNWELELETARVRVSISYGEPADAAETPRVLVWRCAERFRPGQLSHIRQTTETTPALDVVNGPKLAEVLGQEMAVGAHLLNQTL